jgi:hypothetical protein
LETVGEEGSSSTEKWLNITSKPKGRLVEDGWRCNRCSNNRLDGGISTAGTESCNAGTSRPDGAMCHSGATIHGAMGTTPARIICGRKSLRPVEGRDDHRQGAQRRGRGHDSTARPWRGHRPQQREGRGTPVRRRRQPRGHRGMEGQWNHSWREGGAALVCFFF